MQIITNASLLEQKSHGTFNFPLLVSNETLSQYDLGSFILHWHPEIELTLVIKGKMQYRINNSIIILKEGDALFCNSGALHSGMMYQNSDCEYVSITFDPKIIYGYENSVIFDKYVKPIVQNLSFSYLQFESENDRTANIIWEMGNIISLYHRSPACYEMDIMTSLQKIWKGIYLRSADHGNVQNVCSLNFTRFRAMISYIELNYSQKITLEGISKHINLCEGECCRLFKKIANMSIFDYIQEYRIKMACDFLVETTYNINRISEMVGYNDANHFAKVFKKYKGMSPREYRNVQKKNASEAPFSKSYLSLVSSYEKNI